MMRSIRTKLFLVFVLLMTAFVAISYALNVLFLEKYFIYKTEKIFIESYDYITEHFPDGGPELEAYIAKYDDIKGVRSMILTEELEVKYNGSRDMVGKNQDRFIPIVEVFFKGDQPADDYICAHLGGPDQQTESLLFIGHLENGEFLLINQPMLVIKETSEIANDFFFMVGLILLVVGVTFIYVYTKKIVNPIKQLNDIAGAIKELDFSSKYDVRTKDEIGQLGESINELSDKLKEALAELVEVNEGLKMDIEKKEYIDEMRKNFISDVSHELKAPIGLVKGYTEGLKYDISKTEEEKREYFNIIIQETNRMDKLVKDLLELSNLESGSYRIENSIFNVSVMVDEVVFRFRDILEAKSITLSIENNDDYFVEADYYKIEQVIINYLTNAIDHIDGNRVISVKLFREEEQTVFSIFNTGNPIPEPEVSSIWDSFYKVDKSRTKKSRKLYGGSGVGLSVVKAIVELHQGEIGVENVNSGVKFYFKIKTYEADFAE